jgi:hypothetical protein
MFNLFGRKTTKEFIKEAKETYAVPEVEPVSVPKSKEYYRVGRTEDGCTTLTFINHEGWGSMTMTMNREACEQMIRMLESTFVDEKESADEPA